MSAPQSRLRPFSGTGSRTSQRLFFRVFGKQVGEMDLAGKDGIILFVQGDGGHQVQAQQGQIGQGRPRLKPLARQVRVGRTSARAAFVPRARLPAEVRDEKCSGRRRR